MTKHHDQPHHPATPAAPAAPPPPPWQPLNWSFPFAPKSGNAADPQTWLKSLASADGGFYPLGANGMIHGGIHFDAGTGGMLKQGDGVKVIADGEVVAYRQDSAYPELTYPTTPPRYALYSTSFVLVRHKLVLPPAPDKSSTSAPPTTAPASAASASSASTAQSYQPPADEMLEFYSLYMHQLDWAGYKAAVTESGQSSPPLQPLPFWLGDKRYRVGSKANDRQAQPPQLNTPFRFDLDSVSSDVSPPGDGGQLVGIAAGPSPDSLGALTSQGDKKLRYALPPGGAARMESAPESALGVRIFDRVKGTVIGLLPRGGELRAVGNSSSGWAQIATIMSGAPVATVAGGTPDPRATTGWVNLEVLDTVVDPKPLDAVVVLDKPYPVKAGDVVGYLGEYQNSSQSHLLPPQPTRALLHVEVFTGAKLTDFIRKSQDRAKTLPDSGKTLFVIQQGAKLVKSADPQDNPQVVGLTLTLVKGDPGKGNWAKVQPTQFAAQSAALGRGHGQSHHASKPSGTPVGKPVWVERKFAGKPATAMVQIWADFPLVMANAKAPATGYQQVFSRGQLDQMFDADKAVDEQGLQWWSIAAGDADGKTISGWVCEKSHPDTRWQSPWTWPGFDTVDTTDVPLLDIYRRNLYEKKQLFDGEEQEFSIAAATVNAGQLIAKLEKAAKRQGGGQGNVVPADLKKALTVPWLAEAVSHLIVRYESEWGGDMSKWEKFLPIMGDLGQPIWKSEMERIKKLRWWDQVKAVEGFPADPDVWHIHPIGLVGNFANARSCNCINYDAIWVQHAAPAYRDDQIVSQSHYRLPIDAASGRIAGRSRRGGDASKEAQVKVIDFLAQKGRQYHLSREDIAMVLAMTRHESGFNPDAAAGTTSASGLGQFVDKTAASYGINSDSQRFDAEQGADAMVRHYLENKRLAIAGGAIGRNIFTMIYAYHHDGPSLAYGGRGISESKVMPVFDLILTNICDDVAG
jgi:hypothetical protein